MTDDQNTTPPDNDWWETEVDTEDWLKIQAQDPGGSGDDIGFSTWGDIGTVGFHYKPPKNVNLQSLFESAKRFNSSDELILTLKHVSQNKNVTHNVEQIEDLLYGSQTNTKIINTNALTPINQLYFHMLRAYSRAQTGDFDKATLLWDEIGDSWLDVVDEYRQPHILFNLYTTSLCMADWDKAIDYLERLWSVVKFMDANKRHIFGIWDEWISAMMVNWIFLKHCQDYRKIFCKEFRSKVNGDDVLFACHKKTLILKHLNLSFVTSVIDESYYNRAREMNKELPIIEYEEKPNADL